MLKVDLCFPVMGESIPVDHGYALYAALSRCLENPQTPWFHNHADIAVFPLQGQYIGQATLALKPGAQLRLRLPADCIGQFLCLAGQALDIAGKRLRLGVPNTKALQPAPTLYAHTVTTKNGADEARFDAEIARQLAALNIQGKAQRGPRRVLRVQGKTIVGHALLVSELSAEESICLQENGLGGRRKMGCGVFVPRQTGQ